MDNAFTVLNSIGLSDDEVKVYLAGLALSEAPASIIARKAGLKRGHTYNLLSELSTKGMATQVVKNKIRCFSVCDPQDLLNIFERHQRELNEKKTKLISILPALQSVKNPYAHKPKVRFFEGEQGIREMYEDTLKGKHKEIYAFADFKYVVPIDKPRPLNEWIWEYAKRRAKKGIWYLGIVKKSSETELAYKWRQKQKRKLKFIKHDTDIPAEINIYGDRLAIFSEYEELIGVIVESPTIAKTLKNIHQSLWKLLD